MATFLDVSGLEGFSKAFVFLLVLVTVYVVVAKSKFGEQKWLPWVVAFVLAIFVALSDLATGLVRNIAPWAAVALMFAVFAMTASTMFGGAPSDWAQYKWALYVIFIIIFLVGAMFYIRSQTNVPGDIDKDGNVIVDKDYATTTNFIFHPKVLGIIFLLLVSIFTVGLLAGKPM